ncbi:methylated-DNA--[protein]-cysteine S-methyltransferase [Caproiciproducens sp.]|uniref:methylated-DNA--[protein]-cysteine S-methyltransferase n=1 Tax=Caproiciproducens sp. TaxID=1954376 RepID=UPI00289DE178|nr:methylated-DNA--[protein]-cysteine S-methyltransferase [Caproiciproducens sp.]
MKNLFFYHTDIGRIGIAENGTAITNLCFEGAAVPRDAAVRETELLKQTAEELREYLAGERKEFTVPLSPKGTEFQRRVWKSLCDIPYGETRSYKEIAENAGSPKGFRAVGMANNRNPIPIMIPCHRVIGADGSLTGYGGGLDIKVRLLELEKRVLRG